MVTQVNFNNLKKKPILKAAEFLEHSGHLCVNKEYVYLKVDDQYIKTIYPILKKYYPEAKEPDYFGANRAGAHISIIYPDEKPIQFNPQNLLRRYTFQITGIYSAILDNKIYYILGIDAPELQKLRQQHGLTSSLIFKKNYLIDFHITIGKNPL